MNPKVRKSLKIVLNVLLWMFLFLSLFMTILAFSAQASNAGYPKLGNTCLLTVVSDSMNGPEGFKKGDLILSHALTDEEKQNLQVGDVITFYTDLTDNGLDDKVLNTHRIIERGTNPDGSVYYITQGDNREMSVVPDAPIGTGVIEAVWTGKRIPVLGGIINFLQSSTGFLVCIVIPLAIFFVYELIVMINTINKIRNKDKKQITKEDEELIKQRAIEEYLAKQAAAGANNVHTDAVPDSTEQNESAPPKDEA